MKTNAYAICRVSLGNGGGQSDRLWDCGVAPEGGGEGVAVGGQERWFRKLLNTALPLGHLAGDPAQ